MLGVVGPALAVVGETPYFGREDFAFHNPQFPGVRQHFHTLPRFVIPKPIFRLRRKSVVPQVHMGNRAIVLRPVGQRECSDAVPVREMLLQHILTKDIFLSIFREDQFHRENNVARQLDRLEGTFFTGDVRRQAIDRLRAYYGVIGRAADEIADYAEKQQFLKAIYEDFYTAYNPAAADRLGVGYTPNEFFVFQSTQTAPVLLGSLFG